MSFSTNDFDKWMQKQGPPIKDPSDSTLLPSQIKMLKEYPECKTANDLPLTYNKTSLNSMSTIMPLQLMEIFRVKWMRFLSINIVYSQETSETLLTRTKRKHDNIKEWINTERR